MSDPLHIDGSRGEGGGQILRTALGLSLVTGRPVRIDNIRARRNRPGLQHQHLTAVLAAAEVSQAQVEGAQLGSTSISFVPEGVFHGEYRFDIGTAGSTSLVFQTLLPGLLSATGPTTLRILGGTHNVFAPPFGFLQDAFLPLVNRMGPRVEAELIRPGFYPEGGGEVVFRVTPAARWRRLDLPPQGRTRITRVTSVVARLPRHIADRELEVVAEDLDVPFRMLEVVERDDAGPGNVLVIETEHNRVTDVFTGFGKKGLPAERVAEMLCREVGDFLDADVPVGPYLADQLLVPLALAGGGSFGTVEPTLHATTNMNVIEQFLDCRIRASRCDDTLWRIDVE